MPRFIRWTLVLDFAPGTSLYELSILPRNPIFLSQVRCYSILFYSLLFYSILFYSPFPSIQVEQLLIIASLSCNSWLITELALVKSYFGIVAGSFGKHSLALRY